MFLNKFLEKVFLTNACVYLHYNTGMKSSDCDANTASSDQDKPDDLTEKTRKMCGKACVYKEDFKKCFAENMTKLEEKIRQNVEIAKGKFEQIFNGTVLSQQADKQLISSSNNDENVDHFENFGFSESKTNLLIQEATKIFHKQQDLKEIDNNWIFLFDKNQAKLWQRPCTYDVVDNNNTEAGGKCQVFQKTRHSQYEYAIIGKYTELTIEKFIQSYVDNDYRNNWDSYTINLERIGFSKRNNCEILNWVVYNPVPFRKPQQYVYARKVVRGEEFSAIINYSILNTDDLEKAAFEKVEQKKNDYKTIVDKKKNTLVKFRSILLLKPKTKNDEPGFEFVMIYYEETPDDASFAIPSTIVSRVVSNTVKVLHDAAVKYKN